MQLHEQTQRFILLLIFYLFGPILTLGIIGGIVLRHLPANARHWEQTLTQQTGLHWEIKSVEFRSPGFVRLHKVEIKDDTGKDPVFYAEQIDIRRTTDTSWDKIFPGIATDSSSDPSAWSGLTAAIAHSLPSFGSENQLWQITAPMAILDFRGYSSENSALLVQNMLRKVVTRFDTLADVPVQFVFEKLYVASEHSQKRDGDRAADLFRLVQGNIYRTASEIRSDWSFEIKDISDIDRLHLSFALSQKDTLDITFRTGKQPIPCDLAAVFYSSFKHFSGGTFVGEFTQSTRAGHNSQTIRLNNVIFQNVPLAPLVGPYTDFAAMGTIANLVFEQAVFGTEGFDAKGNLEVLNGAVEKTLFHRCVGNFDLSVQNVNPNVDILNSPERMVPFTACVIHFQLQPRGIDFWADDLWSDDAIMCYRAAAQGPVDWIVRLPPRRQTVTYHEFMSVFAPDSAPTVPLTPGLQSVLPFVPIQ